MIHISRQFGKYASCPRIPFGVVERSVHIEMWKSPFYGRYSNRLDITIIGIYNKVMNAIIEAFDRYLARRGLHFQTVIIGGAALIALGIVTRTTKDVDCLFPEIPDAIKQASKDFARENPSLDLIDNWLNNGPIRLVDDLPEGWRERLAPVYAGQALVLQTLGRTDLLKTKLFALCDRLEDWADCVALAPTAEELDDCLPWVTARDANAFWAEHVRNTLVALAERNGHV